MRDRVFISHSSRNRTYDGRTPTRAARLRDLIYDELGHKNYSVFLDLRDIGPGLEWRSEILTALDRCHAFVVLLDEFALASDRVRQETTIALNNRAVRGTPFVVPVLVDGVGTERVRRMGFTDVDLLQAVRLDADADADDVARVADKVTSVFAELPSRLDPADAEWAGFLSLQLRSLDDELRYRGAAALGIEERLCTATRAVSGDLLLAVQLLNHGGQPGVVRAVGVLRWGMRPEHLARVVRLLHPSWVDRASARKLRPPDGPIPLRSALNASNAWVGRHYLDVAFCFGDAHIKVQEIGFVTGEDADRSVFAELRGQVADATRGTDRRCYLVVVAQGVRPGRLLDALDDLAEEFPDVAAILLLGPRGRVSGRGVLQLDALAAGAEELAQRFVDDLDHVAGVAEPA
ncbi:toll/interleukin-1 receptor domain-containing protein [Saccharothrix australiensis]|uniref:TIR domain-containing protein n=1 Tax=Saccharothrix australiensis TaxID=2072 RepID=A0A495W1P8_9PSEU|nr:toll/interleukin-1 receptor domain-containing protein [Saccharothrix australiensis]RKT55399.1 TIR domain-containing protein [Saccharothrix australiensis]